LNEALDRWERRHPVAHLEADKHDAERKLSDVNNALSHYGKPQAEALLDARDEAQKKIERLRSSWTTLDGKKATSE
jgi:hypothetical protein